MLSPYFSIHYVLFGQDCYLADSLCSLHCLPWQSSRLLSRAWRIYLMGNSTLPAWSVSIRAVAIVVKSFALLRCRLTCICMFANRLVPLVILPCRSILTPSLLTSVPPWIALLIATSSSCSIAEFAALLFLQVYVLLRVLLSREIRPLLSMYHCVILLLFRSTTLRTLSHCCGACCGALLPILELHRG